MSPFRLSITVRRTQSCGAPGHGLGIVDGFLRNYSSRISQHVVIEPHPDVLKRVDSQDWAGVTFRRETWQESLKDENFGPFDAVFFDMDSRVRRESLGGGFSPFMRAMYWR